MNTVLRPALVLFLLLSVICCGLYPLAVTGIGKVAFADQVAGSLMPSEKAGGSPMGSRLIGQAFSSPKYFWSRPSATSPMANNATSSSGSNLGAMNPALIDAVKGRIDALKAADPQNKLAIPVDLVTASASGLDPDISVAAAYYQVARVAQVRHLSTDQVRALVDMVKTDRQFGFLGEPSVNVLALNRALDKGGSAK